MSKRPLTLRQLNVHEFIVDYWKAHKVGPTYRDIAINFGIALSTAHEYVKVLRAKGAIKPAIDTTGTWRSIIPCGMTITFE